MLRIGTFAKLAHTSIKTLRFYDAKGLLRPAHVDRSSGYRYYAADQVGVLRRIQRLKACGFPLTRIREALRQPDDPTRLHAMLLDHQVGAARQVSDAETRLSMLNSWVDELREGREAASYAVRLERIEPQTLATIRTTIANYAEAMELFQELGHAVKDGDDYCGPRAAIWHTCGDAGGPIDCEAFVVARKHSQARRRVRVQQYPATLMACLVYQGRLDGTPSPYAALRTWVASRGYCIVGSKRELYWQGRLDEDRPSDVTEIQFPIRPVA